MHFLLISHHTHPPAPFTASMCKCGARARLVSDCKVCLAARERRLSWRRRAENGVQHDKPRLGWSPGPMIIVNYIIGIWTHFGATIHGDAAKRLERQARVQTVNPDSLKVKKGDNKERRKKKERMAKKQQRYVTFEGEVAALWGAEGLRPEAVAAAGHRIVDTHAGGGNIAGWSLPVLRQEGWKGEWVDNDIKAYA